MDRLEAALDWADGFDIEQIADRVQEIGFECTRCGKCCQGTETEPHTAIAFPDEVRAIRETTGMAWSEITSPMPFGVQDGAGETFEWALQTDDCNDCVFLESDGTHTRCTIYGERPLICRTYPFSLGLPGTGESEAGAVAVSGRVRASECPGLGAEISHERALAIAEILKERAVRELQETIALRDQYRPRPDADGIVVHDSEGAKDQLGRPLGPPVGDKD